MHTEVFNNIDILINMANSTLSIDEINMELIPLKRQISNKKSEIEDLKSLMNETRYFNASNELVDKNIEISLKNKISRLNRKIKDIKNHIEEIKSSEKALHTNITNLKDQLTRNETYVKTLTIKANNSEANNYYKELLAKEEENVKSLELELDEKNKDYRDILKELELNNQASNELNDKLETEKNRLNDVLDNLENPNAYIDVDLKKADEEKLASYTEELERLEKRKLELLTDANMIGTDAKELIVNNEYNSALAKIKELITIIKTKPYMDITSNSILEEELEKKEALRVELSAVIDNKNYNEIDSNAISKRVSFLKSENETLTSNITVYQNEINTIDEFVNSNLGPAINEVENEILNIEKSIKEYRNLLKEKNKNNRSKANLENVIAKKEKEKEILNNVLTGYKDDLLFKISRTNILKNLINRLEANIEDHQTESINLEKISLLDFRTKDVIEEENDKEKLRLLNEEIKNIKNRQQYDKNPDEIYDQIEMYLANLSTTSNNSSEKKTNIEIDDLFLNETEETKTDINNSTNKDNKRFKVINMIPVETIKKDDTTPIGGN